MHLVACPRLVPVPVRVARVTERNRDGIGNEREDPLSLFLIETQPVPWTLARTLPHHTHSRVPISVDLWAIATGVQP